MADRLTQLQDCLDQLATQFYASIRYLSSHHAKPSPPPAPTTTTITTTGPTNTSTSTSAPDPTPAEDPTQDPTQDPHPSSSSPIEAPKTPPPDSPDTFAAAQRELASDLLLKVAQIEYLIGVLPGVETSAQEQEARIRELEGFKDVEGERGRAVRELEAWRERVEEVIGGVVRGTGGESEMG